MTNEDLEAFRQWWDAKRNKNEFAEPHEVWQAAITHRDKQVAELQEEVDWWRMNGCEQSDMDTVRDFHRKAQKRIAELEAIVAKLPTYADTGKSFVPTVDEAWTIVDQSIDLLDPICVQVTVYRGQRCYSTREAATATGDPDHAD